MAFLPQKVIFEFDKWIASNCKYVRGHSSWNNNRGNCLHLGDDILLTASKESKP